MAKGLPVKSTKPVPVKIVSDVADSPKSDEAREKKWRAESDLRTMQEAEGIKKDKERMKAMKQVAKEQMKNLQKIC
jgi:protein required for attachment to host cells